MLYDPSTANELRPWLVRTLEPICDADPEVLSEYVLALLKHDAPEPALRDMFIKQLDDFIQHKTEEFVDLLFGVLKSKEYVGSSSSSKPPQSTLAPPLTNGSKAPSPASTTPRNLSPKPGSSGAATGQKRRLDDSDDQDVQRKGSRMEDHSGGAPSRPLPQDNSNIDMIHDSAQVAGTSTGMGNTRPRAPKGICYNYHNHGYCSRGATCPYSHGDNPLPMNSIPFQFQNNQPGGPNWAPDMMGMNFQMPFMMNPNLMNPRAMNMGPNRRGRGGRFQQRRDEDTVMVDVTPNQVPQPMFSKQEGDGTEPSRIEVFEGRSAPPRPNPFPQTNTAFPAGIMNGLRADFNPQYPQHGRPPPPGNAPPVANFNNQPQHRGTANMVAGKGSFPSDVPTLQESLAAAGPGGRRSDIKTLVVEKIPSEHLSLEAVNNWFKKFGTVTNVAIDARGSKALVSFQTHEEARAAWKSQDAVFGNRFVKVFWHRPMEGQGQAGAKALLASAPLVKHIAEVENSPTSAQPKTETSPPSSHTNPSLESHIAEQKALFEQLPKASPEEKKEIMARLRKLGEEMKSLSSSSSAAAKPASNDAGGNTQDTDSSAALRAKLASLQAEATRLGVDANSHSSSQSFHRGFTPRGRGRGRGRGGYYSRGRGGPPMGSNKTLDLRPKKLNIKGVPSEDSKHAAVREWYETTGELEAFQVMPNNDIQVLFRTRQGAEQALAKGNNINGVGPVHISWQADGVSNPTAGTLPADGFETDSLMDPAGESAFPSTGEPSVDDDLQYDADDIAGAWAFS